MKKKKGKITRSGATDEEIIRWSKTHDAFDGLEAGVSEVIKDHSDLDQVLREPIFQDNTRSLTCVYRPP